MGIIVKTQQDRDVLATLLALYDNHRLSLFLSSAIYSIEAKEIVISKLVKSETNKSLLLQLCKKRWSHTNKFLISYADKLVQNAVNPDNVDKIVDELFFALQSATRVKYLADTFSNKKILISSRCELVDLIFPDLSEKAKFLLKLVTITLTYHRFIASLRHLLKSICHDNNFILAYVYCPVELNEKQKRKLEDIIKDKYKKTPKICFEINKKLIGGIKIQVEGKIIDASVFHKLKMLRNEIS